MPPYDSQVFTVNFFACGPLGENAGTQHIFGHNREPRGVAVQTVAAAEDKGLILLVIIPRQRVCQRIIIIMHRRMNGHARRLMDDQQILVFIQNGEGERDRNNPF